MVWSSRNGNYWQAGVTIGKVSETDTTITLKYTALFRSNARVNVQSSITWDMSTSGAYSWSSSSGGQAEGRWIESENDAEVTLGTKQFTVNKTTSGQTVSASNTVKLTSVSSGTQTASTSYSIPAKTSYTVSYNANGGSGAPSSQTKWYGTNLTLSSSKPTRKGYTFKCWNTKSDGSGTNYNPSANYTTDGSSVTLYAQWTENTMSVYYCGNGADYGTYQGQLVDLSDVAHTDVFLYDNSYTTGLSNVQNPSYLYLSRTGYSPTGYWLTAGSNFISVHEDDTSLNTGEAVANAFGMTLETSNQAVRVYAQWQKNNYTINYNPNGGHGNIDSHTIQWEDTFTYSKNTFVREGYKFIGWNLYRNNDDKWYVESQGWLTENEILTNGYSKKVYKDKETMTLDSSWISGNDAAREFTLYAIWEISGVVYIDNGTSFEPYLTYIDNGLDWELYLVYVDNGSDWNIMS